MPGESVELIVPHSAISYPGMNQNERVPFSGHFVIKLCAANLGETARHLITRLRLREQPDARHQRRARDFEDKSIAEVRVRRMPMLDAARQTHNLKLRPGYAKQLESVGAVGDGPP
jgi:hypothetical protein